MKELVNHILYVAGKNNKKITHLQLHKIAYFTLGYLIRESYEQKVKSLYKEEGFEAWLYGPVLPKVYEDYKKYNSTPILSEGNRSIDLDRIPKLNDVILNLVNHDVFDLVNLSHKHEFWQKNKDKILNNKRPYYNYEYLRREFAK